MPSMPLKMVAEPVIAVEDTDVMVLCISFRKMSCPLYKKSGTQTHTRYIDISKVAGSFGNNICQDLIKLDAFTGCYTVSAFAGRGNLGALKCLKLNKDY